MCVAMVIGAVEGSAFSRCNGSRYVDRIIEAVYVDVVNGEGRIETKKYDGDVLIRMSASEAERHNLDPTTFSRDQAGKDIKASTRVKIEFSTKNGYRI